MNFGIADPEMIRVHIASREFKAAQNFVAAACNHPETEIENEVLLLAAIVCYARPFSQNERGSRSLAHSTLSIDVTVALRNSADVELHERLLC